MKNQSIFLETALEAAKQAEKIILKYFSPDIKIELKQDQSPVTLADQEAENLIIKIIKSKFPDHGFLGEETGSQKQQSSYMWIIDPIDGTKNYTRGLPLFATQIALFKDNEIILGVSNAPVLKELMYAEKGKGCFLNETLVHTSNISEINESFISYGGIKYFEENNYLSSLLSLAKDSRVNRGIGDFWSYHLLAQGKIDVMLEAKTKIWDIAAAKIIVSEAGGLVTDLKGNQLNSTTTITSILASNKPLHPKIKKYFTT